MKLLFWICLALTAYAYIGYALLLVAVARIRRVPVAKAEIFPRVSIIIAARNEEANLPAKIADLRRTSYPPELLQIVVASDASTDRTEAILSEHSPFLTPVIVQQSTGKPGALNAAVAVATGEILVFLDARQIVEPDAVARLVACFADPSVGAASGELLLQAAESTSSSDALGIYWKIEKLVRKLESESGSVVGVTGAIYAMRRELYSPIPPWTILDDVYEPMQVIRAGKRVIFEPGAIARDRLFSQKGKEFSRKVRTLTGNYQLLRLCPWLLTSRNPVLFRLVSHKLARLAVPFLLVLMLISSALAGGPLYHLLFGLQVLFYLAGFTGVVVPSANAARPVSIASTFIVLNAAAAQAFYNFLRGRNRVWIS